MRIALAFGSYLRNIGKFPELAQFNMVAERTPTQLEQPMALIARPGLQTFATVGSGGIRGINRKAGLFSEAAMIVASDEVYLLSSDATSALQTGTLETRKGRVQIAMGRDPDGNSQARIVDGTRIYLVTGGTVTAEAFPAAGLTEGATSVAYLRQFWFAAAAGTQQVYYLVPGDTDWNALDFASAEYQPDPIQDIAILGEQIWLLGSASTEVWALTGQTSPALQPYGGLAWNIGCKARDSVCVVQDRLIWVTDTGDVRMTSGGEPQVISNHGISEQIRKSDPSLIQAWTFSVDQHYYYVLSLENQTWIYDMVYQLWTRANSLGYPYWRAGQGCDVSGNAYAADILPNSNVVWKMNPEYLHDAGDEMQRVCTAFFEVRDGRLACGNVSIVMSAGQGTQTGQGSDPVVQMRYSDTYGQTFTDWKSAPSGNVGDYGYRVRWNRLGLLQSPGRYFQFRVSDPVTYRMSDARLNEVL